MTRSNYMESKREGKRARIFFEKTKYRPQSASSYLPVEHKATFAVIQGLGQIRLAEYERVPNHEMLAKPWHRQNILKANTLVLFAQKCRKENRNEAGWRNEVETRVFAKFDFEVNCKLCRKRLWRSEVEAIPTSSNSRTSSLEERQRKREPCQCNVNGREDILESGISELFSSRLQEFVCQKGEVDPDSYNPKRAPDRVHGLQRTKTFADYFQRNYAHEDPRRVPPRALEDVLKVSIHPENGGDPLLFPFLIVEAKGEKGSENFEHMEIQTQFPIRHMLHVQYQLTKVRGHSRDVLGGPLVWFFAYRGEDWRVYGGYVHEEDGRPTYRIEHLWSGTITGPDEALQLTLIVDHILDWARDTYRHNILRQLHKLTTDAMADEMTIILDPDICSLRGEVQPWVQAQNFDPDKMMDSNNLKFASPADDDESSDPLAQFKTPQGLIRDARIIESRLRGVYITRDNVSTFLQGFENPNTAMRFVRSILAALGRRCVVLDNEEVLNAIEDRWTGNIRHKPTLQSKVYAQFRLSYYINHTWEQIRELTYLAVSEDAREILIECAKFRGLKRSRFDPPECRTDDIIQEIEVYLKKSVRQGLIAALARRNYMLNMIEKYIKKIDETGQQGIEISFEMTSKADKDKKSTGVAMQGIVQTVYEMYRIGKREPSEPFIRVSARVDSDGRPLWRGWSVGDKLEGRKGHLDKILVFGDVLNARYQSQGAEQKLCLYILDGQTEQLEPFSIIGKLFYFLTLKCIYGTIRKGKIYKTSKIWSDNRAKVYFNMCEVQEHLKISEDVVTGHIFDWIKILSPPVPENFNYEVAARGLQDLQVLGR